MSIVRWIRNRLADPRLAGVNYDSDELLAVHRQILENKTAMRQVFREFYDACLSLDKKFLEGNGLRAEIGAGVSMMKKCYPAVLVTDVKHAPNLDMVVDAQRMPFENESARAIYGINCFHHLPSPDAFFKELGRVLVPGGGGVLIEPYYGPVASRFYKKLFDTESFDKTQKSWSGNSMGYMKGANQALSYIVFRRDLPLFHKNHPSLRVVYQAPLHNYMRYLVSGGLNFRQLVPDFVIPAVKAAEYMLRPMARLLALHHVVVIKKGR